MVDLPEDRDRGTPGPEDPGGEQRPPPTELQVRDELAREILRIHEESYGKGAGSANAIVFDEWVVVILDEIELLPNEKFLIESGKADTVTQVRHQYQLAIQSSFRAAVERATGRTVVGFASTNSVKDPRFMAEIFRLGKR